MRKPGRPLGPIAVAVLEKLRQRRLTARELAHELQLSIDDAKKTCSKLFRCGLVAAPECRPIPGANKPARVYTIAGTGERMAA